MTSVRRPDEDVLDFDSRVHGDWVVPNVCWLCAKRVAVWAPRMTPEGCTRPHAFHRTCLARLVGSHKRG